MRSGERVTIECRPLNMSLIQGPSEGPELIAGIRNDATGKPGVVQVLCPKGQTTR